MQCLGCQVLDKRETDIISFPVFVAGVDACLIYEEVIIMHAMMPSGQKQRLSMATGHAMHVCVCVHVCMHMCMYACVYACVHACVYAYVYAATPSSHTILLCP